MNQRPAAGSQEGRGSFPRFLPVRPMPERPDLVSHWSRPAPSSRLELEENPSRRTHTNFRNDALVLDLNRIRYARFELFRIGHASIMLESWSRPAADRDERSAAMERFITERRPELVWMMELDLFACGDQKGASLRMLKHIERYLGHKNEAKWIEDFESLVKTGELPVPKEDGKKSY